MSYDVARIRRRTKLTTQNVRLLKALAWGGMRTYREISEILFDSVDIETNWWPVRMRVVRLRRQLPWLKICVFSSVGCEVPETHIPRLKAFLDG